MERRIAITGIGWMTPLGWGVEPVWEALLEGRSGIGPITLFDAAGYGSRVAGEVPDFEPSAWIDARAARRLDRFSQFCIAAAVMAVNDSGIDLDGVDPYRRGALIGSGAGGIGTIEEGQTRLLNRGPAKVPPLSIPKMMINAGAFVVASQYNLRGPGFAVVSACSTGAVAITQAASFIRSGMADVMLAGGAEASITPLSIASFCACGAITRRNDGDPATASRPFDLSRDGFVMAEGAGVLLLEDMDHAKERGSRIYAELAGWGLTNDAHHVTAPEPSSEPAARSMTDALAMAGESLESVGYVNAHGTGTPLNDPAETHAIRLALGGEADRVPVSSTKSMTGHMLGAAGAVEAAIAAMAVSTRRVPPTINVKEQDPACDLDVVTEGARDMDDGTIALSNSFAFGGHNVCLAVRRV
jgi:3-oxoacyl-[acyl-carrier-protein] synthase II